MQGKALAWHAPTWAVSPGTPLVPELGEHGTRSSTQTLGAGAVAPAVGRLPWFEPRRPQARRDF